MLINFPQSVLTFDPPLFERTELWQGTESGTLAVKLLYYTLYKASLEAGLAVNSVSDLEAEIVINWGGSRFFSDNGSKEIIFEHGWMPRYAYQASPKGANFESHVASNYVKKEITQIEREYVKGACKRLQLNWKQKLSEKASKYIVENLPERFIMVPLQSPRGLYFKREDSRFSKCNIVGDEAYPCLTQEIINTLSEMNLPYPVVLKQDPRDPRDYKSILDYDKDKFTFLSSADPVGSLDLFASEQCIYVCGINTNALHEALAWGKHVVSLGRMIWSKNELNIPLSTSFSDERLDKDFFFFFDNISYLHNIFSNQWYLDDFFNPYIFDEFIKSRGLAIPKELRDKYGSSII